MAEEERMRQGKSGGDAGCQEEGKRTLFWEGYTGETEALLHKSLRVPYRASGPGPVARTT